MSSSAPLALVLELVRYIRAQDQAVTTAQAAEAAHTSTQTAGRALTTARQRGYVAGHNGTWTPGPVEPGSTEAHLAGAQRRHQDHRARRPSRT